MNNEKTTDNRTMQVEQLLREKFPNVSVYTRPRTHVIRIRILDDRFENKSADEREKMVWPLLDTLPKEIMNDITFLLLSTKEELNDRKAFVNNEFEHPVPSAL